MIPRSARTRQASAPTLRPRYGRRELPPWPTPTAPRCGWTTETVFQAALDCARSLAGLPDLPPERGLVIAAYHLLLEETGLYRISIMERISGLDRFAIYLGRVPAHRVAPDDDEEDAPRF
jgi:hypothetical protein